MIEFKCACGKEYAVKYEMAGQSGTCKECGAKICIPEKGAGRDYYEALVLERFRDDENFLVGNIPDGDLPAVRLRHHR